MNNVMRFAGGGVFAGAALARISGILRGRSNGGAPSGTTEWSAGHIDQTASVLSRKRPDAEAQSDVFPKDRLLYIRGWAAAGANSTFGIAIDDGPLVPIVRDLGRPDVDAAVPGAGPNAGFEAFVDISTIQDGIHTVALHSVESGGTKLDSVTIRVAELRFHTSLQALQARRGGYLEIDAIRAGTRDLDRKARALIVRRDELIIVQSWAINELDRSTAARAYLLVDQSDLWPVRYGMARDDVAQALGSPGLRYCGFRAVIDPSPYTTGEHTAMLILGMNDGSIYSCGDSFVLWLED